MPALITVGPVKVFAPLSVMVPVPVFVKPMLPVPVVLFAMTPTKLPPPALPLPMVSVFSDAPLLFTMRPPVPVRLPMV